MNALRDVINVNAGFLCWSSHWRPNPDDPDPDMPGQKLSMSSFIPAQSNDTCLCGSGKTYAACCRPERYWHPICPNPGLRGYSFLVPQNATFHSVDGATLRARLSNDKRLHCVENSEERGFWIYWGDPPCEDQYGILCFGDFELKNNETLAVITVSHPRMEALLKLLKEITDGSIGVAEMVVKDTDEIRIDKEMYRGKVRKPKWRRR
ncbi:MAG: SEC-C metal-binding domain-containing protein [Blastocatellia bacterium]